MTRSLAQVLADLPDLATEAFTTWGTRPITGERAPTASVPSSRVLADLDRLIAASYRPDRAYGPRLDRFDGMTDGEVARDWHDEGKEAATGIGALGTWVRHIIDELDIDGTPYEWPQGTVAACCEWLHDHLPWIEANPLRCEGLEADMRGLWATLRRVCRISDRKPWPCLTDGCQGNMRQASDGDYLVCENNHKHSGLTKWRLHPSMPVADAASALNVPERTLRHWVRQGGLPTDEAKGDKPAHVWPWDVIRLRYPEWVEAIEAAERERREKENAA